MSTTRDSPSLSPQFRPFLYPFELDGPAPAPAPAPAAAVPATLAAVGPDATACARYRDEEANEREGSRSGPTGVNANNGRRDPDDGIEREMPRVQVIAVRNDMVDDDEDAK